MGTEGPMEVEIKAPVDRLEPIRRQLADLGARFVDEREQTDTYFDHPGRSFAETDEALRVRRTEGSVELTYKGPKVDQETKTREEIDLAVDDEARARELLTSLSFEPAGRVVKRRETFRLDELTVALDQVEGLGSFVEIETVVEGPIDEARQAVLEMADELGLEERERRSYLGMLLEGTDG